ncbi:uncharacterized protein RCC_10019 [Ramularia collo-cygni]|uniref:Uncharacterized protein n=1 Tax=Ramularia collo-cygni TaxID=112498 RepID=A0A2D3VQC0_9PEZI|nr:uncharacterized protein RCC_10019 [Ramularia collo-cygni]CZT24298.1 uncharacterized protein RCC_10019 [Ramularia collo-cygni]
MRHHHLSSRFSALAATIIGSAPAKQTGLDNSRPTALGVNSSSAARIYLTKGGGGGPNNLIMGKSNKFDYSKRGSSGAKLGHIISRDLKKEAERAHKDAEKAAGKVRTRSNGSCGSSSSALGHVTRDGVVLDIQVPFKDLGDEGACAMATGLEDALHQGLVLLEDVNLSGNGITTVSLARLAPVIRLARHELKTLNLAGNNIKVETVEEAEQWETFLESFKHCFRLRRLDLSGNVGIGALAFEIMAKVYVNELPINPLALQGETSVISLNSEEQLVASTEVLSFVDNMSKGAIIKRRMGLRSIPYITLTDTGLDDLSALWLSCILEEHHCPTQLIDGLNATPASSKIATYQQNSLSRGVDWNMKHPDQNRDGLYVLQKAEKFREQVTLAEDEIFDDTEYALEPHHAGRQGDRRASRGLPGDRASVRSIRTADGGEHELSELESARRRLQRSLLTNHGASKVELWSAALRLVISSRVLTGIGPSSRNASRFHTGPPKFDFTTYSQANAIEKKALASRPVTPKLCSDHSLSSPKTPSCQGTYAATLTANSERDVTLSDTTNTPRTAKVLFKPHRKGVLTDSSETVEKVDSSAVGDRNPQRFVQWQEEHMKKQEEDLKPFRDERLPSNLPSHLVDLVAGFTVTERAKQRLSDKQLQAALSWGRSRTNLETEKEWRRMADGSQIWTLLESIGCLAYHRK